MTGDDFKAFREGDKWGFMAPDESVAIPANYDAVGSFSEGLARVRVNRLWGFVRLDGSMAIAPRFEQARHFSGGYAKVKEAGIWSLIDTKGFLVENMESPKSYVDDRGRFVSEDEHSSWEKPPGQDEEREGK